MAERSQNWMYEEMEEDTLSIIPLANYRTTELKGTSIIQNNCNLKRISDTTIANIVNSKTEMILRSLTLMKRS